MTYSISQDKFLLPASRALHISGSRHLQIMLLALLLISGVPGALAQDNGRIRTMVLIPKVDAALPTSQSETSLVLNGTADKDNPDKLAYIHFDLSTVPDGARIDDVVLKLYLKEQPDPNGFQYVSVYELRNAPADITVNGLNSATKGANAVATVEVGRKYMDKNIDFSMDIENKDTWLPGKNRNLWYVIKANSRGYKYYSSRSGDLSRQPKLEIAYHMPEGAAKTSWPQYKYGAQHTGQGGWASNTNPAGFTLKSIVTLPGANFVSSDPVLCNGMLVFYYQASDVPKDRVRGYSENGVLVMENKSLNGVMAFAPVADRQNNIYYMIDNAKKIKKLDANNGLTATDSMVLTASVLATPVVGFDGALYLSTSEGVYAYTPFPNPKLKWKYVTTQKKSGIITLSEDEAVAYVYEHGAGLTAIDNVEGRKMWTYPVAPHVPDSSIVASVSGTNVFFINGFRSGDTLYAIQGAPKTTAAMLAGIRKISSGKPVSQQVVSDSRVFIINDGKLESYSIPGLSRTEYTTPEALNPASALAMDNSSNVYILNTLYGQQSLTTVPASGSSFINRFRTGANLMGNSLLVAPDGKLFTRNDNYLYALSLDSLAETGVVTIPIDPDKELRDGYLYQSGGKVIVTGKEVSKNSNMIIHGMGGVIFYKGFTVKKGAQVIVQTGK